MVCPRYPHPCWQIVRCVVLPPVDAVLDVLAPGRPKGKPEAGSRDKKRAKVTPGDDSGSSSEGEDEVRA